MPPLTDYPGATWTSASGINDAGTIVGSFGDAQGLSHGFILNGGIYSYLDYPGGLGTNARAINNLGAILGYYGVYVGGTNVIEVGFIASPNATAAFVAKQ